MNEQNDLPSLRERVTELEKDAGGSHDAAAAAAKDAQMAAVQFRASPVYDASAWETVRDAEDESRRLGMLAEGAAARLDDARKALADAERHNDEQTLARLAGEASEKTWAHEALPLIAELISLDGLIAEKVAQIQAVTTCCAVSYVEARELASKLREYFAPSVVANGTDAMIARIAVTRARDAARRPGAETWITSLQRPDWKDPTRGKYDHALSVLTSSPTNRK